MSIKKCVCISPFSGYIVGMTYEYGVNTFNKFSVINTGKTYCKVTGLSQTFTSFAPDQFRHIFIDLEEHRENQLSLLEEDNPEY
ncbi:MAG: hypothetical protein H0X63_00010 [Flavobacteriales bacterium]|nr:hypothetical protein [Flavobacteriales bacterium]